MQFKEVHKQGPLKRRKECKLSCLNDFHLNEGQVIKSMLQCLVGWIRSVVNKLT